MEQKVEGIREAPLGVLVCCDRGEPGVEVLGGGTIPETLSYSVACAVQNLSSFRSPRLPRPSCPSAR